MTANQEPANNAFAVLGDPTRRKIFEMLSTGPRSVGELAADLPVTRSAVSQHLGLLQDARLVAHSAVGTEHVYRLDPIGVALLRDYLDSMWQRALGNLKSVAETSYRNRKKEKS